MAKISMKNLRKEIPMSSIPGKIVRAKEIVFSYLMVVLEGDEYMVCTYEKGNGYTHASRSVPYATLSEALIEYQMKELELRGW